LVTKRDAIRIITPQWQKSALHNWLKEPQFSSRCPECMLDITGPRVLIHYHMKVHDAKRTEVREGEDYSRPFRIHFPTFKEFS
ncbi:MAG: hypothetical protein KGI08_10390, partial [Thaumarchaeota archaeon]|nr:hypothetical protein [Nitrososphaerota archaeon]